jgi:hypothetical protein
MMYWVGMNTPQADAVSVTAFNSFYDSVHVPEVMRSNPGFARAHRFELVDSQSTGVSSPRWLAIYEVDEAGAQRYIDRADGPRDALPHYTPGPPLWEQRKGAWRMVWRRIASAEPAPAEARSLCIVGFDLVTSPSTGSDAVLLSGVDPDSPEATAALEHSRTTTYELVRAFRHPDPGCPRFCAIVESTFAGPPRPQARSASEALAVAAVRASSPSASGSIAWVSHYSRMGR